MRRFILYGVIIFQIALIISLVRGIQLSRRSVSRIASMQEAKSKLQEEQNRLRIEGNYVQSQYYLEKVARDELHLSKPGETVVILPDLRGIVSKEQGGMNKVNDKPNWQKWWEVLSGQDQ